MDKSEVRSGCVFKVGRLLLSKLLTCPVVIPHRPIQSCYRCFRPMQPKESISQQCHIEIEIPLIACGTCCFAPAYHVFGLLQSVDQIPSSDTEYFVLPGLPNKIELTKLQLIGILRACQHVSKKIDSIRQNMKEAEAASFGVVCNTFEALEPEYIKVFKKVQRKKVWCIGPVSLSNKDLQDKAVRGNKTAIDEKHVMEWLDLLKPKSALYVCLGSLSKLGTSQLIELGAGLGIIKQAI
ncbi:hypothetical protein Leryth_027435, partial [Lithospermum erythrorhizon]